MGKLLMTELVKLLEDHPELIAQLIHEGLQAAVDALKKHNAAKAAS